MSLLFCQPLSLKKIFLPIINLNVAQAKMNSSLLKIVQNMEKKMVKRVSIYLLKITTPERKRFIFRMYILILVYLVNLGPGTLKEEIMRLLMLT